MVRFIQDPLVNGLIREGDHLWTHVPKYFYVQHHGICVRITEYGLELLGVIHFDGENSDEFYLHPNCVHDCRARRDQRRNDGIPEQNVRFSCFICFSRGRRLYRCEYGKTPGSVLCRETGSRSTQPSRPAHMVADVARAFYWNNNFGDYHVITRNCEDFARFCKIGDVGSKQVARGIVLAAVLTGYGSAALTGYVVLRFHQRRRLKKKGLRR